MLNKKFYYQARIVPEKSMTFFIDSRISVQKKHNSSTGSIHFKQNWWQCCCTSWNFKASRIWLCLWRHYSF